MADNPTQHAAYAQALENLTPIVPALAGKEGYRASDDWEESIFDFIMGAYTTGGGHGAAREHLRRAVRGDLVQCCPCWGAGATEHRGVCASCGGTGTVALRA